MTLLCGNPPEIWFCWDLRWPAIKMTVLEETCDLRHPGFDRGAVYSWAYCGYLRLTGVYTWLTATTLDWFWISFPATWGHLRITPTIKVDEHGKNKTCLIFLLTCQNKALGQQYPWFHGCDHRKWPFLSTGIHWSVNRSGTSRLFLQIKNIQSDLYFGIIYHQKEYSS